MFPSQAAWIIWGAGILVGIVAFLWRRSDSVRDESLVHRGENNFEIHQKCKEHMETSTLLRVILKEMEMGFKALNERLDRFEETTNKNFEEAWKRIRDLETDTARLRGLEQFRQEVKK